MASPDLVTIMTLIKEAGDEKLKSTDSLPGRGARGKAATNTAAAAPADDAPKVIPPYLLACFNALASNLMEREDNKRQDLRDELKAELIDEFQAKLDEKDAIITLMETKITALTKKVRENYFEQDAQAQYIRSENIKIQSIEYQTGEDTNKIVKDVFKYCGVPITDNDISTSHRLMSKEKMDAQITPANRDTKIPAIIVRVNRRDLKTKLLEYKKTITTNAECPDNLRKAMMYEDVTPLRSRIMYQLRNRNNKKEYRYVWSKGGRIYAHTGSPRS